MPDKNFTDSPPTMPLHFFAAVVLSSLACTEPKAAEAYDNCTGFIDSVPTTITSQGTWCLRRDVTTAITSGSAVTIAANNVLLDCNEFKIGGLPAGPSTVATGIYSNGRSNITIRNCHVRGFLDGIIVQHGSGHVVEDNNINNNTSSGIALGGIDGVSHSVIRRNRVQDIGGYTVAYGISSRGADVIDNIVSNVFITSLDEPNVMNSGIQIISSQSTTNGHHVVVSGNRVSGISPASNQRGAAINAFVFGADVSNNILVGTNGTAEFGIYSREIGTFNGNTFCRDNIITGFTTAMVDCEAATGNIASP